MSDDIDHLRDALDVVHHGIEAMPDSRAKARLASELEALRTELSEMDRPENGATRDASRIRRRVMSLQLVVSKA